MGQVATNHAIFPDDPRCYTDPSWEPYPYDPEAAKQLLAEAGWADGFPITVVILTHSGRPECEELSEGVAVYWEQLGLDVSRHPMDYSQLRVMIRNRETANTKWGDLSHTYGDSYRGVELPFKLKANWMQDSSIYHGGVVADPWLEEHCPLPSQELDEEKRCKQVTEVINYVMDNYYSVPLVASPVVFSLSDKVGEYPTFPGNFFLPMTADYVTLSDSAKAELGVK
jgi:peptide/nickel transport system substrate-binding protein